MVMAPSGRPRMGLKRKKNERPFDSRNLGFYPELPESENNVREEYVRIESLVPNKPMMALNQYLVRKEISRITKNWSKFSRTREGHIILKIQGEKDIEEIKRTTRLGMWEVKVAKDEYKNTVKGVIYSRDLVHLTDEEVYQALDGWCIDNRKNLRVKEVYVPKKYTSTREDRNVGNTNININIKQGEGTNRGQNEDSKGVPRPFGLVIVTFDALSRPATIGYGFDTLKVRKYVPNPMRCRKCQALGHTHKRCTSAPRCQTCGRLDVENHTCEGEFCINCNAEGHLPSNRACRSYLIWKEYEEIQVDYGLSRFEAKKRFHTENENIEAFFQTKGLKIAQIIKESNAKNKKEQVTGNNLKGVEVEPTKLKVVKPVQPKSPTTLKNRKAFMAQLSSDLPREAASHEDSSNTTDLNNVEINVEAQNVTNPEETDMEIEEIIEKTNKEDNSIENNINSNQQSGEESTNSEPEEVGENKRVDLSKAMTNMKELLILNNKINKRSSKKTKKSKNNKIQKETNGSASEGTSDGTSDKELN